ncbi:MAG: HD domain-containing phosphohydrolase [Spirochaetales bacterium]
MEKKKKPYFSNLPKEEYLRVVQYAKRRNYLPGDTIVREKTLTDTFCIIEEGKVEVTKKFSDGEEMTIALLEEGDFFGEMALLDQGPRSASVRALTETVIQELSRENFETLLLEHPTLAYGIMRELGTRLRETGVLLVSHLERKNKELQEAYLGTVQALVNALEARDPYMRGHTERVTHIAIHLAKYLQIEKEDLFALKIGALLHDLGKIGISDMVLQKQGPLSEEERYRIMEHPQLGENILRNVHYLERSIPSILYHHERIDGNGYPGGLSGSSIPLFGRIIAVADSVDAMMSDRPYRHRLSLEKALEQLKQGIDKQFDREVVQAFFQALENGELDEVLPESAQKQL